METNSAKTKRMSLIFAGPSGAGKSTMVKYILKEFPQTELSISATNREIRSSEVHRREYHFLSNAQEFKNKIKNNEFLEWQEVYEGTFYGTLKVEVERVWNEDRIVVFDVDVQGAMNLKRILGENACSIFVGPPSIAELEKRLRLRATESEEKLQERLTKAENEMSFQDKFDQILINDDLETAKVQVKSIVYYFLDLMRD